VRRPRAGAEEEPLRGHAGPVPPLQRRRDRDGQSRRVLDVDLEVILEVLADAGQVVDRANADRLELPRVADARELQELRRVDRAAAEEDLPGPDGGTPPAMDHLDADGAAGLEEDARHERPAAQLEVLASTDRAEIGARRIEPPAAVDRPVEGGEALLAEAVHVVRQLVAGLLDGLEERAEERARRRAALEDDRACAAAPVVRAGEAGLH